MIVCFYYRPMYKVLETHFLQLIEKFRKREKNQFDSIPKEAANGVCLLSSPGVMSHCYKASFQRFSFIQPLCNFEI